ncbi:hypothetical protein DFH07DRAFT_851234 [Mycena maculata]|uniref:F-box domain-containing protein n=1 Tax=Mycena maculata TaxID=230809 RepID=A0AAD7HVJ1_9AGAR|nr:hypothetical protein DFH07DRAFT_851234 [Mycena maculata]
MTSNVCSNCALPTSFEADLFSSDVPSQHLLRTNEHPTDAEVTDLQQTIEDSRNRIIQLDRAIAALQSTIDKHRRTRQMASDHIRKSTLILSVSRRLPTDILAEIFNWTVPDEPRKRPTDRSPWVLGRICSRWRSISVSLPELWTNIDRKIPLAMVKAHLDRSIPHPLTVELGYSDTGSVELLVTCSSRWEAADVEMRGFMGPALTAIHGRLPALRRLKYNDNRGFQSFGAFAVAPALRHVVLSGRASLELPWAQLERLNLKLSDSAGLAQLRLAQSLVELTVTGRPYGQTLTGTMELPRLRTLLVKDGGLLQYLTLPALEDMYVSMDVSPIPALIARSNCPLKRFTTDVPCLSVDIIPILEHAPALVHLRVTAISDILLLARLTIPADFSPYLRPIVPALRELAVSNVADAAAGAQVVAMMESRRNCPACPELALCILDWAKSNLNLHTLEMLAVLRQGGFAVEFLAGAHSMDRYRSWRLSYP